jgi:hypothetical protein
VERAEPLPALVRLASLDPVADRERRLALAARLRAGEGPMGAAVDSIYVYESRLAMPAEAWRDEMYAHLAAYPDHHLCRATLAGDLAEEDPPAARALLDAVKPGSDASLAGAVALTRAESFLAEGDADHTREALAAFGDVAGAGADLGERERLLRLELALLRGDDEGATREAKALSRSDDPEVRAAALVLRWSAELAAREELTYRADVDAWLAGVDVEQLRNSVSRSTQALLLLEGRTDAAAMARALGPTATAPTLAWVTLLRDAALNGALDEAALARAATAPSRHAWATRLARHVAARRAAAG